MPVVMVPTVDVPNSIIDQLNNEVGRAPSDLDGNDEKMVNFLNEAYMKSISNEIREKRREKKQRNQEALVISQNVTKIPELDKNIIVEQELKQQLSSPAHTSTSDQTSEEQDPSLDTTQNIVCIFRKANKLGQEAILYWYYFIEKYDKRIDNLVAGEVKKKTATSMVYQEIKQLLPDITDVNLRQKILRARKLYKLFSILGLEKIKQVSYSADAISSLNYQQIQNIIDYMNSVTSLHNETVKILHDQSHVTLKTVSYENDQIKAEITSANILSASQSNPTCDRFYFHSKTLDQYPALYREFSSENFDYYGITDETSCPLCKLDHNDEESIEEKGNMSKSDKVLNPEYLDWHAKLTGLPKNRLLINSKPENKLSYLSSSEQCEEKGPITFEVRPDPELIIKSVLEHFPYLKFRNSFRGIDNYDFTSLQPWSSPCPICNGIHGNYGLHGTWYCKNGNRLPYDPELVKLYSQDKLEYCLTCNTSSNKLKFAIVV
ncbi:hypothetical protein C1645_833458 [Glomus cerebriforme]|uniref:Uncharacterized protein n=1 Tax=Glomus cerebriforme TaxID=658196 RepID=A0A397SLI1_9GLOM|nr:hypothetical protein C1645_833458 [Glomus cerebriforme]